MKPIILSDAEEELTEAARYYETRAAGVGVAFIAEVHRAIAAIVTQPYSASTLHTTIRKKALRRYPYSILYSIEDDLIVIVAVAHHKRRPMYWHKRLRHTLTKS